MRKSLLGDTAFPSAVAALLSAAASASPFATTVHSYDPAPGQYVNSPSFNDPSRALGAPLGGGTSAPNNSSQVSLGGFGGSITLGFARRVLDHPQNPLGMDAIVFGNAFWMGADPGIRFAEAAVIEISLDANGNGLPDDAWFVVRAPSMPTVPADVSRVVLWDDDASSAPPPANIGWYPSGAPGGSFTTSGFLLAPSGSIVVASAGAGATDETVWGLADTSPTLRLGDLTGASGLRTDNRLTDPQDAPSMSPEAFYTAPDNPFKTGIDPGSCGGDAFDIAWAVDPATGAAAGLPGFDFIRISTSVDAVNGPFGEFSPEIDAVGIVRRPADVVIDGRVDAIDLVVLLGSWGPAPPGTLADLVPDGRVDAIDLVVLLGAWGK